MKSPRRPIAVRLRGSTIERVEALTGPLSAVWPDATVSDILRLLVLDGLDRIEREGMAAVNAAALLFEDEADEAPGESSS